MREQESSEGKGADSPLSRVLPWGPIPGPWSRPELGFPEPPRRPPTSQFFKSCFLASCFHCLCFGFLFAVSFSGISGLSPSPCLSQTLTYSELFLLTSPQSPIWASPPSLPAAAPVTKCLKSQSCPFWAAPLPSAPGLLTPTLVWDPVMCVVFISPEELVSTGLAWSYYSWHLIITYKFHLRKILKWLSSIFRCASTHF